MAPLRSARWPLHATLEELHLLQFVRGAGGGTSIAVSARLTFPRRQAGRLPWLGLSIAEIPAGHACWSSAASCARTHPRCWPLPPGGEEIHARQPAARRRRRQLIALRPDPSSPSALATELAGIVKAVAEAKGAAVDAARWLAACSLRRRRRPSPSLASGRGRDPPWRLRQQHAQASTLHVLARSWPN
ncbi:MAG: hypothetical protein R3E40_09315 [Rhodocyclaceae bacterium]